MSSLKNSIQESIKVHQALLENKTLLDNVSQLAFAIVQSYKNHGKVVLCGNGGSASDALHFAGELVGRFERERCALPAVVLNADVATMTAISNDYGYCDVFARQVEGFVNANDVFIGISTSGNSENIYAAAIKAKEKGALTAAFLGKDGGKIAANVDLPIVVAYTRTARIQEAHILLIHSLCEIIEKEF